MIEMPGGNSTLEDSFVGRDLRRNRKLTEV